MLIRAPIRPVPALVAAAVALSGCGGSHAATKTDVIAQANQICQTAASSVRSVPPSSGQSLNDLARYYRRVVPIVETEVAQLRAIREATEDRPLLDRYLAAIGRSVGEYRALEAAARDRDRGALTSAGAALRANPAAGLAGRYGLTECDGSLGTASS